MIPLPPELENTTKSMIGMSIIIAAGSIIAVTGMATAAAIICHAMMKPIAQC